MIHSYTNDINQMTKNAKKLGKLNSPSELIHKPFLKFMMKYEFKHFEQIINSFEKPEAKSNVTRCWNEMSQLRSNSLCSICSGRHKLFFFNSKALISDETCLGILEIWLSSFGHFVDFIQGMKNFAQKLQNALKQNLEINASTDLIIILTDAIHEQKINQLIHDYLKSQQKNKEAEWKLCSALISISSGGFITKFHYLFKQYRLELFKTINSNLKAKIQEIEDAIKRKTKKVSKSRGISQQKKAASPNQSSPKKDEKITPVICRSVASQNSKPTTNNPSSTISRKLMMTQPLDLQNASTPLQTPPKASTCNQQNLTTSFFVGDVLVLNSLLIQKKVDSSYSSRLVAIGANNNELSAPKLLPINMTSRFP